MPSGYVHQCACMQEGRVLESIDVRLNRLSFAALAVNLAVGERSAQPSTPPSPPPGMSIRSASSGLMPTAWNKVPVSIATLIISICLVN